MHSHFNLTQFQRLMASPLIVRSAEERRLDEQEVVLMLNDFSFEDPEAILARLKKTSPAAGAQAPAAAMPAMPGMAGMPGPSPPPPPRPPAPPRIPPTA